MYAALIMDLKKSRSYSQVDRFDLQEYAKSILNVLNDLFRKSLEFDVIFSGGDEVQGLFRSPEAAYLYYRLFHMLVMPAEIRAGIGVGEWNIRMNSASSTEQDGPVYHLARYAIESVDDSLSYSILFNSGEDTDVFINSAIQSASMMEKNQSLYQNELYILAEMFYPIDANNSMHLNQLRRLNDLLARKNHIQFYAKKKVAKKYPLEINFEVKAANEKVNENDFIVSLGDIKDKTGECETFAHDLILEAHPIDALYNEDLFYISSGKIKGLSGKLSKILGTSRQSIDKSIKAGNIYPARNANIAALKLIILLED